MYHSLELPSFKANDRRYLAKLALIAGLFGSVFSEPNPAMAQNGVVMPLTQSHLSDSVLSSSQYDPVGSEHYISMPETSMSMQTMDPMVNAPMQIHSPTPMPGYTVSNSDNGYAMSGGYASTGAPCCPEDCRDFYVHSEGIWFKREGDDGFSLSRANFMDGFSYDFAGRFTIGQQLDCLDGVEAVYTGPLDWRRSRYDNRAGLTSIIGTSGGYLPAQVDTFNDSIVHLQTHRAQFQSLELNRRWFAWDIMSTLIGIKGIDYEEDYTFDAVATDGGLGFLRNRTDNFLVGAHVGADMLRPISQRLSVGARSRVGVFANFNEGSMFVANRGTTLVNSGVKDTDLAAIIETGAIARYRILKNVVATGGYEFWYLAGVATSPNQPLSNINPGSGLRYSASDEVIFHGATAGMEVSF